MALKACWSPIWGLPNRSSVAPAKRASEARWCRLVFRGSFKMETRIWCYTLRVDEWAATVAPAGMWLRARTHARMAATVARLVASGAACDFIV